MKTIPLTQGKIALVDDADYEAVSQFKWYAFQEKRGGGFYAARNVRVPETGKQTRVTLHAFLFPGVEEVHHKDGNGLNCQRYNLQPCTHQQNLMGFKRKAKEASSPFRGVSWRQREQKWRAAISFEGKYFWLGAFSFEIDAAKAYDKAARRYFGEFACPNFPL